MKEIIKEIKMGKVKIFCGEGKTKQAMKAECDINNIMKRYKKNGQIPGNMLNGIYADVSEMSDYQESLNKVIKAETLFMKLPVEVRKRFGHDPIGFVDFAVNPENEKELISWGLAKPKPIEDKTQDVAPTSNESAEVK